MRIVEAVWNLKSWTLRGHRWNQVHEIVINLSEINLLQGTCSQSSCICFSLDTRLATWSCVATFAKVFYTSDEPPGTIKFQLGAVPSYILLITMRSLQENVVSLTQKATAHHTCVRLTLWFHPLQFTVRGVYCGECYIKMTIISYVSWAAAICVRKNTFSCSGWCSVDSEHDLKLADHI